MLPLSVRESLHPLELTSGDAHAEFTTAMTPTRFDVAGLSMILYPASPFEAGLTGWYLRPHAVTRPRQTTCYYSSSDAVFADRVQAGEHYADIARGLVPLEGGWRVYSSGPGLFLRLVVECLLGVRRRSDALELDPVLAPSLDGLEARVPYPGGPLTLRYAVRGPGHGVRSVRVDGVDVQTTPLINPYRTPGVAVATSALRPGAVVDVEVGR